MPILVFLLIFGLFYYGVSSLGDAASQQELSGAEQSIRRSAVHCYATEGFYPADLAYLEQHYGLVLNHEKYIILYEAMGDNVMPFIRVLPQKAAGQGG
ncbi:MAG: hypothetical protein Q4G07_01435 [Oscillospiraceae bacterium]|nr:hypothetical protein [Oscillospiraceae bacterium]